jgi:adenylate cyclase
MLKAFHDLVDETVTGHRGVVVNFMGDGAMMLFGALDPDPDQASNAVEAAEDLISRTRLWISRNPALSEAGPALDVRIGAHYGPVILSRLGSDTNQHVTATGDTVNVASRLLAVAAEANARLALSAELTEAAGLDLSEETFEMRTTSIRGRTQTLEVWLLHRRETRT